MAVVKDRTSFISRRNMILQNAPHIEECSGNVASFVTDVRGKVKSCEVEFTPTQDLHGQSGPYPPGASHNKLEPNRNVPATINGVTITYNNDGRFYFNGKATDAFTFRIDNWESVPKFIPHGEGQLKLGFKASVENTPTGVNYFSVYYHKNGGYGMGQQIWFTQSIGMIIPNLTLEDEITVECEVSIPKNAQCNNFSIGVMMTVDNNSNAWAPYENECPIAGTTNIAVRNDKYYPGQIMWNQLCDFSENGSWRSSSPIQHTWVNGVLSVYSPNMVSSEGCYYQFTEKAQHVYLYLIRAKSISAGEFPWNGFFRISNHNDISCRLPYDEYGEFSGTFTGGNYDRISSLKFIPNQDDYIEASCCMLFDLTLMFGAGKEITYEQFMAFFPQNYYYFNQGELMTVSEVNGETTPLWSLQLGDTFYFGKVDFVTGTLTATYKGITLNSGWNRQLGAYSEIGLFYNSLMLSDCKENFDAITSRYPFDKTISIGNIPNYFSTSRGGQFKSLWVRNDDYTDVADFTAAMAGTTLVYELNTPRVIQLSAQQVYALHGQNNFFHDVINGDIKIKYWTH